MKLPLNIVEALASKPIMTPAQVVGRYLLPQTPSKPLAYKEPGSGVKASSPGKKQKCMNHAGV
jgi:hypothetical protein